jgi:hypothetical protein
MSKTLDEYQAEIGAWQDATFPNGTLAGAMAHFEEEVKEFTATGNAEEAADCLLLLIACANKLGFRLSDAIDAKMVINRKREWDAGERGYRKHIEAAS